MEGKNITNGKKAMAAAQMVRRVVVVTGCDSGLGWAVAARAAREGLITVAGVRSPPESPARQHLQTYQAHTVQLDVTSEESVRLLKEYVLTLLNKNPDYRLYAVINNAGVMTAGEFEWLTPGMLEAQVAVNLLGAMRVARHFLPELRRSAAEGSVRPRLINVGSHCGVQPLPCFAAYSASKSGLLAWTRALRIELQPYGVKAVAVIPGGFVTASHIMSRQTQDFEEMSRHFDEEQRAFHGGRVDSIRRHLSVPPPDYSAMAQEDTISTFMRAITDENPQAVYKAEGWRYKFYFALFMLPLPEFVHNWLVNKFVAFPTVD